MDVIILRHPSEATKYRQLDKRMISEIEPLLVDILQEGKPVVEFPPVEELRNRRKADVEKLDPGVRRLMYPHIYHVSLSEKLWNLKQELIASAIHLSGQID
jgi:nicotinate phosphoribosyltransferase